MKPLPCWPLLAALVIWFAHFLACWAASELVWPRQQAANIAAWIATAIALVALALLASHQHRQHAAGGLPGWQYRIAQGATALAAVAVVFTALPSAVLRG